MENNTHSEVEIQEETKIETPEIVEKEVIIQEVNKTSVFTIIKTVILTILVIAIIVFVILNHERVELNLLLTTLQVPLFAVILISYVLGSLITWLTIALKKDKKKES